MKKIVMAVNGSACAGHALEVAASIVGTGGLVLAVQVEDVMAFSRELFADAYDMELADDADLLRQTWQDASDRLKREILEQANRLHLDVQWHVLKRTVGQGAPAQVLYRFAVKERAEAILVGQHQGSRWIEGLLGSFPHWLVTHSALPVVVIAPPQS